MADAMRGRREREKRRLEASATKGELAGPDPSVAPRIKRGPPPPGRRATAGRGDDGASGGRRREAGPSPPSADDAAGFGMTT